VVSRIWIVALGVAALAASCTSGSGAGPGAAGPAATPPPVPAGSADRACTPHACISLSRLASSIDTQLEGKVAGYVALIGTSIVVSSGFARTTADPPKLAMGPDVMVNVLSVGKMFTTIAVLRSLARHHLSTGSRIWPFLPPDWVKGPGVDTITFGELLTHRAGFRLDSGLVFQTGDAAREQIRHGVQQVDQRVADYNNINFTIFKDMLPFMEGAPGPRPAARAAAADRFFISYVQRQVFDPAGVTDATCAPVRDAMLMYPPPGDRTARGRQAPAGPSGCSGGGWFMTPASMRRVLDGLISDSLLSASQRQQMDGNCLGWDCSNTSQAGCRGKGGGPFCDGSACLQIFFGILAGTIPVVIATNSDPGKPLSSMPPTARAYFSIDLYVPNCFFAGHAFTLRSRVLSCFVDRPYRLRVVTQLNDAQVSATGDSTQGWPAVHLVTWSRNRMSPATFTLASDTEDALWRSTSGGYVPPAITKSAPHPCARAPACRTPSHDRLYQRRRGCRAPQDRGPPVFLSPAQATTVASHSPPTRAREVTWPLDLFPQGETLHI
jgi:CubicO group peptidase (beta-lactamase class C family)